MLVTPPTLPPPTLDARQLARSAKPELAGQVPLAQLPRWAVDAPPWPADPPLALAWQVSAQLRTVLAGPPQTWLHLRLSGAVPQICQRCLTPYLEPIEVDCWFRFVPDEATAQAQDESCDEDLLVWTPQLDLLELIEDELLLALPLVPMHAQCPTQLGVQAQAAAPQPSPAAEPRPHPFAALAALKKKG